MIFKAKNIPFNEMIVVQIHIENIVTKKLGKVPKSARAVNDTLCNKKGFRERWNSKKNEARF